MPTPTPISTSPPQTHHQSQTQSSQLSQPLHSPPLPLLPTLLTLLTDLSTSLSATSTTSTSTNSQHHTTTTPNNSQPQHTTTVKDLQTNLLPLRLQIKRMRAAIADLPDGERSVEEQRVEMRALEERVRGLRGVVGGLGREGGGRG